MTPRFIIHVAAKLRDCLYLRIALFLIDRVRPIRLPPPDSPIDNPQSTISNRQSPIQTLNGPWPPGCDHRSILEGEFVSWFLLRPGATTPKRLYLTYWNKLRHRRPMACPN